MLEDLCEHLNPYIWLFAIHLNFNIKTKKNLNCIFNIVVIGVTLQVSFTIMHQIIIDQLLNALKFQIANNNCIRLNEKYIICLNVLTFCSKFLNKNIIGIGCFFLKLT
jgi:hypothetical protein